MCQILHYYKGGVTYVEINNMSLAEMTILYNYAKKETNNQKVELNKIKNSPKR